MTGANHLVTGAVIGAAVVQPAVALPLALASHFVLDALPHYGDTSKKSWLGRNFNYVLIADAIVGSLFLLALLATQPVNWGIMALCAVISVLPDVVWVPHYIADMRGNIRPMGAFARFSKWIQWGERPWGLYVEIVFFAVLLSIFTHIAL